MGDFNDVRSSNERHGSCFNPYNARCFNRFISNSGLVDINMEGYAFTWSHPSASKMSKLDRFLVSDGIFTLFPSITAICLDRHLSDHRPILLCEVHLDFGPIPFRFYHSWFDIDGFEDLIKRSWLSFSHSDANRMIRFEKKLQDLKVLIRQWIKTKNSDISSNKHDIVNELREIDKKMDRGEVDEATILKRFELKNNLIKINDMEATDNLQKSKVKWAIEGDENSKFFHGIINKRRSQLAIRGVFVDGIWCSEPDTIKDTFLNHFAARFSIPPAHRFKLSFQFQKGLTSSQAEDLERSVSNDEIRRAVWNCGDNKSPGPDGFTFEFFKRFWDLIGADFCDAVNHFFLYGAFSNGCNSSFIALIPKVIDAKFMNDFRPISLIGCIYKVVTKVLANRLVSVIQELISDTQSAFVAGRQILDGPFILDEILHWCKRKNKKSIFFKVNFAKAYDSAVEEGLLKGIQLSGSTFISHLFYADDAMFLGEWSEGNLKVEQAAASVGCTVMNPQFRYLGVMVGHRSSSIKAWDDIIFKLRGRLSKWKERITGKKITWVAWNKVLTAKNHGGLGVSSYFALNRALLLKWVWRFISNDGSLWCQTIRALYGQSIDSHPTKCIRSLFWYDCWIGDVPLFAKFPWLFALELNKVVSVADKLNGSLADSFRRDVRGGRESHQMETLNSLLASVSLSNSFDRWFCDLTGDGEFRVKEVRNFIDDLTLPSQSEPTRWVRFIPIKVNIFAWRARLDCLPTRVNLARRGVHVDSSSCSLCDSNEENVHHLFFCYDFARLILRRICLKHCRRTQQVMTATLSKKIKKVERSEVVDFDVLDG
uniref:RNA-directed DNA polymerase, eukaryota n=1 Tax=Tanacetum cinerariifolium TaxID=118510 RepID=A0A699H9Q5_TANCI|nr:RNA-directed DNA polymerase, eukaryota [Tanacetum cinerariifolium]